MHVYFGVSVIDTGIDDSGKVSCFKNESRFHLRHADGQQRRLGKQF